MEMKEITTKSGTKVSLKQILTGKDVEDSADAMELAEKPSQKVHVMIEAVVMSINGSNEKIVDRLREMSSSEYNEIVGEVTKVYTGDQEVSEAKKDVEKS